MASVIDLSGLNHFMQSVDRYGKMLKDFYTVTEMICKEAERYAKDEYARYGRTDITVSYDNSGKIATISANGDQVAFYEFGTGRTGSGTYQGALPARGVPITSSWYYFYPSPAKRVTAKGREGWWWDNKFQVGIEAEAQMWNTFQFIMAEARLIVQRYFKGIGGGK